MHKIRNIRIRHDHDTELLTNFPNECLGGRLVSGDVPARKVPDVWKPPSTGVTMAEKNPVATYEQRGHHIVSDGAHRVLLVDDCVGVERDDSGCTHFAQLAELGPQVGPLHHDMGSDEIVATGERKHGGGG